MNQFDFPTPKLIATTELAIVAMQVFNGKLYVATEHGIYVKTDENKFVPLEIVVKE